MNFKNITLASLFITTSFFANATEFEFSGKVGIEQRYFIDEGSYSGQLGHHQSSVFVNPELYWHWNDGDDSITFQPYYRYDNQDSERTHFDIRELSYLHVGEDWELKVGIRKEYWGVTEFQHLVDVLNQTDLIDSFDGEQKLGQQMINLSLVKDWGIIDLYVLPGFREKTFGGEASRLRSSLVVDEEQVAYESDAGQSHVDLAARWSHSLGDFDWGVYWFRGTNRDPLLEPSLSNNQASKSLQQYYDQIDQFGIDVQATKGDILWKFESIYQSNSVDSFWATQAGLEYTYVGIFNSAVDIGLLAEHSWDSRGTGEDGLPGSSMQNDLFVGSRIVLNDVQSSELLIGIGSDLEHSATTFIIEASRRIADSFKANLEVRVFQSSDKEEPLYMIQSDDYVGATLEWYF